MKINDETMVNYENYSKITGQDILEFMKTRSRAEIEDFKAFCKEMKITKYKDGTTKERKINFFEIRNWVLDKYYPGLRNSKKETMGHDLLSEIMEL